MKNTLNRFLADDSGATAIEYGVLALIMGIGIIASLKLIPPALDGIFGNVGANLVVN